MDTRHQSSDAVPLVPGSVVHIRPSAFVQRGTLVLGLGLVGLECVLFWLAARFWVAAPAPVSPRELGLFVALGTLLTVQAMLMVGLAWVLAAIGRTELFLIAGSEASAEQSGERHGTPRSGAELHLRHPWREWYGRPEDVAEVWVDGGWLHARARGHWRTWHVRLGRQDEGAIRRLRPQLPPGSWLDPAEARRRLSARVLLPLLTAAAVGAAVIIAFTRWLDEIR